MNNIINRLIIKFWDVFIGYPARIRWYPVFSRSLNCFRLKFYLGRARSIKGFKEVCFDPIRNSAADIRVDGRDVDLFSKIYNSLCDNGICVVSNVIPEHERGQIIEASDPVFERKVSISPQVDITLKRLPLSRFDQLRKITDSIVEKIYGTKLEGINVDCQIAICKSVPEADVPYNNTWHTDRFLPSLKLIYAPNAVALEDGPFTFLRGSHKIDVRRELDIMLALLNKGYQGFDEIYSKLSSDLEIVSCACDQNTLIIAMTNGFHVRGKFSRLGARSMAFIDFYYQFGKFSLLNRGR